jgi:hypothetical protein
MTVLDAVRRDALPDPVAPEHIRWQGTDDDAHLTVEDVDRYCELVGECGLGFTELSAPWTRLRVRPAPAHPPPASR